MIEADPLAMATIANNATQTVLQAGPPADLPAQVPDFVSNILETVGGSAGDGGLGETISELTPGGTEAAEGAEEAAGAGAEQAADGAKNAAGAGVDQAADGVEKAADAGAENAAN